MFDMNKLWEQFVYVSLRRHSENFTVTAQSSKYFWQPENGYRSTIKPDIVINKDTDDCIVLDTKWKILNGYNPSPDDLRQMYVYHEYYNAQKVALVYPGEGKEIKGTYFKRDSQINEKMQCSVLPINVETSDVRVWQEKIADEIKKWIVEKQ